MANYHKKRAARNSTATCMCKYYKKLGNSKERRPHRDQVKLSAAQ